MPSPVLSASWILHDVVLVAYHFAEEGFGHREDKEPAEGHPGWREYR